MRAEACHVSVSRARRAPCRACSSAAGSPSSSSTASRHRLDVAGGDDAAGLEPAHVLAQPADVVGDGRHAGPQRAQQRARLVESRLVRERSRASRRRRRGRPRSAAGSRAATRPGCPPPAGSARPAPSGRRRPAAVRRSTRFVTSIASSMPLYGPDQAEAEQRVAVVRPGGSVRMIGWGITRSAAGSTPNCSSACRPDSLWATTRRNRR